MAFGLEIAGTFQGPGLWTGEENGVPRRVSLEMIPAAALERSRADCGWETLRRIRVDDDGRMLILDGHLEHGYRVHADGFGSFLISRDGRRVLLAPEPVEAWRWQRLLTAQVLPIASLLQGLELFHASAVELDGHGRLLPISCSPARPSSATTRSPSKAPGARCWPIRAPR